LAGQKIADDRFAIGPGGVGLVIGDAELAMVVQDQVRGDIVGRPGDKRLAAPSVRRDSSRTLRGVSVPRRASLERAAADPRWV
jgi:hypothetical protein